MPVGPQQASSVFNVLVYHECSHCKTWSLPVITLSSSHLEIDYDSEDKEPLAFEGAVYQEERVAPDANFHSPPNVGVSTSDSLESGDYVASPSTFLSGSLAIDTPTLAVHCSNGGFGIALRTGRLGDLYVKGMCQGERPHHSPLELTKLTRPPFPLFRIHKWKLPLCHAASKLWLSSKLCSKYSAHTLYSVPC